MFCALNMGGGTSRSCGCSRARPRKDLGMYKLSLSHEAVWGLYVAGCMRQTMEALHSHEAAHRDGKWFDWRVEEDALLDKLRDRVERFRQDSLVYFTSIWNRCEPPLQPASLCCCSE